MGQRRHEFSWKVGGESGEGIDTTGELLATALNRMGYHVYAYRHFPSRIRGGHTNYKIRIADGEVRSPGDSLQCLVAFDQGTIDWNWPEMRQGGMIVHDTSFKAAPPPDRSDIVLYPVPLTELAQEVGNAIMKNMVAIGVSAAFLGLEAEPFMNLVHDYLGGKGQQVVEANQQLIQKGYQYCREHFTPHVPFTVKPTAAGRRRYLMSGNDSLSYGALAAGCRFLAAYPITPATEIMTWLQRHFARFGGIVVQVEDELAAVNMAIGAAYAGARAMASTSGPGFSLMTEGMGLAGATETPLVIVDDQRAGPSTGLPTKTEQSDLGHMVHGGHGDFPRIVVTPLTVEDCFQAAVDAFNLAEEYQCPVILAPDLSLGMCKQSVDGLDTAAVHIDRGRLADPEDLALLASGGRFKRYLLTDSGISPRSLPSQRGGQHLVTGSEHDELGYVVDTPQNRRKQQGKRLRKLQGFDQGERAFVYDGPEHADILLLGFGGTTGAIMEAAAVLRERGHRVARGHLRIPHPFPTAAVAKAVSGAERILVVENNGGGQLMGMVCEHVAPLVGSEPWASGRLESLRKSDGTPFVAAEIVDHLNEALVGERA